MVSKSRPRDRLLSRRDKVHGKTRPVAPSVLTKNKKEIKKKEKKRWWRQASRRGRHQQRKCVETTADGNNRMNRETGRTDNAIDASLLPLSYQPNDRQEIWGGIYKKKPRLQAKRRTLSTPSMIYTGSSDSLHTF